jgi:transposase InsO family protein
MPWKITSLIGERVRLIRALLRGQKSVKQCCHEAQVSRTTVWKWRQRFWREGRRGLHDRSRRPHRMPRQTGRVWVRRIERLRRQHPNWGAKKLRAVFGQAWRQRGLPCVRTIARWVERLGLVRQRRPRPRKAGRALHPMLTAARRANQVWTVDFKGWFRTGDGTRVEPLTVRDLFSRYGLAVRLLADQRWQPVQAVMKGLFRENGMPEVIRVDNGGPFASNGPAGLSRLSVWWMRLGIRVEFTRPGHPEDNGAHEQFHRVQKRETAQPPARTPQGQQHRTTVWLKCYNQERPHEALEQCAPLKFYRKSGRRYPQPLPPVKYPIDWTVRQIRSNGEIRWKGRRRFVGEAFVGQPVGLKRLRRGVWGVYFIHLLIGHLHDADAGATRPMVYRHRRRGHRKTKM